MIKRLTLAIALTLLLAAFLNVFYDEKTDRTYVNEIDSLYDSAGVPKYYEWYGYQSCDHFAPNSYTISSKYDKYYPEDASELVDEALRRSLSVETSSDTLTRITTENWTISIFNRDTDNDFLMISNYIPNLEYIYEGIEERGFPCL